jgi:hypothetical protein
MYTPRIVVLLFLLAVTGCTKATSDPKKNTPTIAASVSPRTLWATYQDPLNLLEIQYPTNWTMLPAAAKRDDYSVVQFYPSNYSKLAITLSVGRINEANKKSLSDVMKSLYGEYHAKSQLQSLSRNEWQGVMQVFESPDSNLSVLKVIIVRRSSVEALVDIRCSDDEMKHQRDNLDQMINSMKLNANTRQQSTRENAQD